MEKPPIFRDEPYAQALERARAEGRYLVLDATAAWCPPCQQLDKTTWRDAAVTAWLDAHAIAVQIDVDAESDLAGSLGIRAMPCVIAFHDGGERDRIVGYRAPGAMLAWLEAVARGETDLDRVRRALTDPEHDMQGRLALARALLEARRFDEAIDELVWLWRHMHRVEPGMSGVRVSFMAGDMEGLVNEHPPARARIAALRDDEAEAAARGSDEAARDARFDWVVLNGVLGDEARTLAWFERARDDAAEADALHGAAERIIPLLFDRGRFADIGRLWRDPVAELRRSHEMTKPPPGARLPPEFAKAMAAQFHDQTALMVRSLIAAGRDAEAKALAEEAVRLDGSRNMRAALDAAETAPR